MAAANIDAVERYIQRIDEYAEDKMHQQKMYKPTVKRIFKLRNALARLVKKLDTLLEKFDYQIDEADEGKENIVVLHDNECNHNASLMQDTPSSQRISDLSTEQFVSMITSIVDSRMSANSASLNTSTTNNSNDNSIPTTVASTEGTKNEAKSNNNKKIIQAYKQMFEDSKHLNHSSEVVQRTISFLREWFDVKIMHFHNMRKVSPKLSYNITWLPNWIRDFVIYIGNNQDSIDEVFNQLESFISADASDNRYTYMVPYEVTEIGKQANHDNITDLASALWIELYNNVFKKLAVPENNSCYCPESLIDYAYLTDAEIQNVSLNSTPEFYQAVDWLMTFQFR